LRTRSRPVAGARDIHSGIWLKLWDNQTFNPISALTHSTLADICRFPIRRALAASVMREEQEVAERLGALIGVPTPHIQTVFAQVELLGRTLKEDRVYVRAHPGAA